MLSDGVAYAVTQVLEQNMTSGTGTAAYFGFPSAGKTGTTEQHADAWFSGFTPMLQTTVWVGYTRGEIPMENVHGIAVSGSSFPSQIWHDYMRAVLGDRPAVDFPEPKHWAVWGEFEKSSENRSFGYTYDPNDYTTTTETTTTETTTEAPTPPGRKRKKPKGAATPAVATAPAEATTVTSGQSPSIEP